MPEGRPGNNFRTENQKLIIQLVTTPQTYKPAFVTKSPIHSLSVSLWGFKPQKPETKPEIKMMKKD